MLRGLRTSCRSYTGLIIVAYLDLDICIITCFSRLQTLIKIFRSISLVGIHLYTYSWPKWIIHISVISYVAFFERCIKYFKIVYRHRLLSILEMPATTSLLVSVICCVCLYVETRIPDQIQSLAIQITNRKLSCSLFNVMVYKTYPLHVCISV